MKTKQIANLGRATMTLAVVLVMSACALPPRPAAPQAAQAPAATAAPTAVPEAKPTSLRIGISRDESTLQPYTYVTGYPGWNILSLIYDALFVMDEANTPQPWLAAEDKVSDDGKTHTLTLRKGVTFHDGKPLTSADVKFAYEFYQKNKHSRWTPAVQGITSIETPDEATVVLKLAEPSGAFAIATVADVPIIPAHVWSEVTDPKAFETSLGSGPYKLTEYVPDQSYRLTANPDHFAGKPAVDELILPIIKDASTMYSALKTGEIDATIRGLAPELVTDFEANPALKVQRGPGFGTTLLQFNDERAPWDKKEVRQAVSLAIDRQKLVDTVLLGYGTAGNPGWFHPATAHHDPAIKGEYDPDKAKALLDGLNYKDGDGDGIREADGKPIEAALLVYSDSPTRIRSAELIAAALKEIGLNIKVTAMEADSVDAKVWPDFDVSKGRDFDLAMWGWSAPVQVNPTRVAALVHSDPNIGSLNIGGFKNADADKMAQDVLTTTNPDEQVQMLRQMEAFIAQELPFDMLYYDDGNYAYRPDAYDQWIYQKGQGIFHKLSFQPDAKP